MTVSGNAVAELSAPSNGTAVYTPVQVRAAYGINDLSFDGTGQTIAIVDAYHNPTIVEAVDAFDTEFGLTAAGPTLYEQYGPATAFLKVLNQKGQTTDWPATDPARAGATTGKWRSPWTCNGRTPSLPVPPSSSSRQTVSPWPT